MRHHCRKFAAIPCFLGIAVIIWSSTPSEKQKQGLQETEEQTDSKSTLSEYPMSSKNAKTKNRQIASGSTLPLLQVQNDVESEFEDDDTQAEVKALDMDRTLKILARVLIDNQNMDNEEHIQALMKDIAWQAKKDGHELNVLIDRFLSDPHTELGSRLGDILGGIKLPEVEQMAQSLAQSKNSEEMKTGLDILSKLEMPNQKTYEIATEILGDTQQNPDALMSAISALPSVELSHEQTRQSIGQLSQLSGLDKSDGVRSASLFKIGKLAQNENDMEALLNAMDKSRADDDRISAVIAIANSNLTGDTLRSKLADRVRDQSELFEIRRYAAEALERFEMTNEDFEAYNHFRREQADLSLR